MIELHEWFEPLALLEDPMERYDWIINYGTRATKLPQRMCTEETLVRGCTSALWVDKIHGQVLAKADSVIVQGISSLVCDWYNQASEEKRRCLDIRQLELVGPMPLLSMGRQNGVANLIARVKLYG